MSADKRFDLYLSYSGRKTVVDCGRRYEYAYPKRIKIQQDRRGATFGIVMGTIFEWFYSKCLWQRPDPVRACLDSIDPAVRKFLSDEKLSADFDPAHLSEVRSDLARFIPPTVELIRKEKLLSDVVMVEHDLSVVHKLPGQDLTMKLGGRADFFLVFRTVRSTYVWILDGKGSRHKEEYTDPEQLIWYAAQSILKYGVAPARLGFIYYKFPDDPLKWVGYGQADVQASLKTTFEAGRKIMAKEFDPRPSPSCRLCPYRTKNLCPEGVEWVQDREMESRSEIVDSVFGLEFVP
jgi:hypothetical protein